jgi:hypothetical protein
MQKRYVLTLLYYNNVKIDPNIRDSYCHVKVKIGLHMSRKCDPWQGCTPYYSSRINKGSIVEWLYEELIP